MQIIHVGQLQYDGNYSDHTGEANNGSLEMELPVWWTLHYNLWEDFKAGPEYWDIKLEYLFSQTAPQNDSGNGFETLSFHDWGLRVTMI